MTRRRKILFILLGALVVLAVAGYVLLSVYFPAIVRTLIVKAVHESTLLEIELGGVSHDGFTRLTLEDLRLTDPADGGREVLYAAKIRLVLDGFPWPWKDLRLDDVRVTDARATAVSGPDGRLNFSRVMTPKPSERKTIVKRAAVDGLDVRYLDLRPRPAVAGAGTALAGGEEAAPPLVELRDINLAADLTDEAASAYDITFRLGDENWGPKTIKGTVQTAPLKVILETTDGALRLTPENLATLPQLPADLVARLKPSATVQLTRLEMGAEGEPRFAALHIQGLSADTDAVGPIRDGRLDVRLNLATFELMTTLEGVSLMGGTVSGDKADPIRIADVRARPILPTGTLRLASLRPEVQVSQKPLKAAVSGAVRLERLKPDDGPALFAVALTDGSLTLAQADQAEGAAPVELPLTAGASFDPAEEGGPIAFKLTLGNDQTDLLASILGELDRAGNTIRFGKSLARVNLTPALIAPLTGLKPEEFEPYQISGTIAVATDETDEMTLELPREPADPASPEDKARVMLLGRLSLETDFQAQLLGPDHPQTCQVRGDVLLARPEPGARPVATVNLSGPLLGGSADIRQLVVADGGNAIEGKVKLSNVPLSHVILKRLGVTDVFKQPVKSILRSLPEFAATLDANMDLDYHGPDEPGTADGTVRLASADPARELAATVKFDSADGLLKVTVDRLESLPLSGETFNDLRLAVAGESEELDRKLADIHDRLPEFGVTVSLPPGGEAPVIHYDTRAREVKLLTGEVQLSDLSATIAAAEDLPVRIENGSGIATLPADGEPTADLDFDAMGGQFKVILARQDGRTNLRFSTLPDRPVRFAKLPKAVRDKVAPLADGNVVLRGRTTAPGVRSLADAPLAFEIELADGMIVHPGDNGVQEVVLADAAAAGTLRAGDRRLEDIQLALLGLADAAGRSYLPTGSKVEARVAALPLNAEQLTGDVTMTLTGAEPVKVSLAYDLKSSVLTVSNIDARLNLGALPLDDMAGPLAGQLASLAPKGRLQITGNATLDTSAPSPLASIVYRLQATTTDFSWLNPQTHVAAPPLDATLTLRRDKSGDPHRIDLSTTDRDYGTVTARGDYEADKVSLSLLMTDFVLVPDLVSLAGPDLERLRACYPSGLFSGDLALELTRSDDGRWTLGKVTGELSGRNVTMNDPGGELKLRGASLKAAAKGDGTATATLGGFLAEGPLDASVNVNLNDATYPAEGQVSIRRLNVRELSILAERPPNELNGRLTVEKFTFKAPLTDLAKIEGQGAFHFGEGHLWQLPLFGILRVKLFEGAASVLRGQFDPTSFRSADGEFVIADGKITVRETSVDSSMIRIAIDGDVLFDRRLDLHLASSIHLEPVNLGPLGNLLPGIVREFDRLRKASQALGWGDIIRSQWHVTGTFDQPRFAPDTGRKWETMANPLRRFLEHLR